MDGVLQNKKGPYKVLDPIFQQVEFGPKGMGRVYSTWGLGFRV